MRKKTEKFWVKKLLDYIKKIDRIWLIIWGTIFISFIVLDSFFQIVYPNQDLYWQFSIGDQSIMFRAVSNGTFIGVTLLKYIGIVLSLIYAHKKFPKDYTLQIALLFTLLADTILTLDNLSVFGVLAFCFAQYFHIARFAKTSPRFFAAYSFIVVLVLMFGYFNHIPDIYVLVAIYAFFLFSNLLLTHRWWKENREKPEKHTDRELVASTCAFYGFILFALCDTNVAFSYLSVIGVLPLYLARYANFFAWLFYYPSQVLISNSSIILEKATKTQKKVVAQK